MHPPRIDGIPLQRYLIQLYWLCVLPLLLLAAWLAFDNVRSIQTAQDQQAHRIAAHFASSVDQQLRMTTKALSAIAQSPHLDATDQWPQLYNDAKVLQSSLGIDVAIIESMPPYRMRLNTRAPLGAQLPDTPSTNGFAALPAALETLQPAIGDGLTSAVTKRQVVGIAVPAVRNGRATYAVVSPVDTEQFQHLLDRYPLPEGWALTLSDGIGQTLAQAAPADFDAARNSDSADQVEAKSSLSRWKVVITIPSSARRSPLLATGGALGLLVLVATLAGALGGGAGGRRLAKAVASLTADGPDAGHLAIKEIQDAKTFLDNSAGRERLSEARFRRLFRDAPVGMRLVDREGKVVAQNTALEVMFGYTLQEAPTLSQWRELAYPDPVDRRRVELAWIESTSGKRSQTRGIQSDVFTITAKGGALREVQIQSGLLADGFLSTFVDVTELRQSEASLRLWAEAFEHSELSLNISDLHSLTFKAVNPAFARLHGYEPSEMVGMPVGKLIPPDQVDRVRIQFEQLDSGVHAIMESENLRKDGSRFPVQIDVTILKDSQGTPASRFAYVTDLTERKRTEAEIRALYENLERRVIERTAQLSQANQELDSFAYTVSHDLRAPLRAMDGFLHLLCEEYGDHLPEDAQIHLAKIGAAIVRMKNLIEGILTLTHSARHDLQLTPVNLSELVSKYLNEFASADLDRKVDFDVQSGLMAVGDARMLEVVVSNLVSNAWKYTAKTQMPSIRFFARQQDGQTWFCMADNGAGFDSAHAGQLFQPFQRMHRHDEFPGIGIGLATVHRIVLRHGGQILAQASPGQGATFRFTLNPLPSDPPQDA
jgi:PAS domain S-box-containing protein